MNQSDTFIAYCSFTGLPLPTIIWRFNHTNGTILYNSSRISITTDIQSVNISSTLTIANVTKSVDEGHYFCEGRQQNSSIGITYIYFLEIES